MPRPLRTALAIVVGYLVVVILVTLVRETGPGSAGLGPSPPGQLAVASSLTLLSGCVGGFVAAWIGGQQYLAHGLAVAAAVVIGTVMRLATGGMSGPLWLGLLTALTLIAGILLGAGLFARLASRTAT